MKQLFLIPDSTTNTISYYHLVCFLAALPFDRFYSQLVLVSFIIHTLIHLKKSRLKNLLTKEVLIVSVLYFISILCIAYSNYKRQGWTDASIQLSLILFPATLAVNGIDLKMYKWALLKIFASTVTVAIVYLYADALLTIRYYHFSLQALFSASFMNHNFSGPIGIHATYLSMYVAFSLTVFIRLLMKPVPAARKIVYGFCTLILMAGLLQLSSRAVCFALVTILLLAFPVFLFNGKRKILFTAIATLGLVLVAVTIYHVDTFKERYVSELKKDLSPYVQNIEVTEPRMARWRAAMELVKQSPVIGYGSGAEVELLKEKYFEQRFFSSYLNQFNAHNEYISMLLKSGIPGLAVYFFVLLYGLRRAWKTRDIIFAAFMLLVIITSVSENILDLNKGIFFYSFFFSFFLLIHQKDNVAHGEIGAGNH